MENLNYKKKNIERNISKLCKRTSLLELGKDFIELKDIELKDRKVKIKKT